MVGFFFYKYKCIRYLYHAQQINVTCIAIGLSRFDRHMHGRCNKAFVLLGRGTVRVKRKWGLEVFEKISHHRLPS
jgi:hypothetical protein